MRRIHGLAEHAAPAIVSQQPQPAMAGKRQLVERARPFIAVNAL